MWRQLSSCQEGACLSREGVWCILRGCPSDLTAVGTACSRETLAPGRWETFLSWAQGPAGSQYEDCTAHRCRKVETVACCPSHDHFKTSTIHLRPSWEAWAIFPIPYILCLQVYNVWELCHSSPVFSQRHCKIIEEAPKESSCSSICMFPLQPAGWWGKQRGAAVTRSVSEAVVHGIICKSQWRRPCCWPVRTRRVFVLHLLLEKARFPQALFV